MYEKDFEGLSPIEILMFDSPQLSGICAQKERRPGRLYYSFHEFY